MAWLRGLGFTLNTGSLRLCHSYPVLKAFLCESGIVVRSREMQKQDIPPTELSVIVVPNGHVIIFQGFYKQALFIEREHLPRFLTNPAQTQMTVVPPFAALALACYTAMVDIDSASLNRDLAIGADHSIYINSRAGTRIGFFSDHVVAVQPRWLAQQKINVAITPMAALTIHVDGPKPIVATIASVPTPEPADYPRRFAADPRLVRDAVQDAVNRTRTNLVYEN